MMQTTSHLTDRPYSRARRRHDSDNVKLGGNPHSYTDNRASRIASLGVALWPLVGHVIMISLIAFLMIFYVNGRSFDLDERQPQGLLADGSHFRLSGWTLLQSDVTTLVSVLLAILRLIVAAWVGPLCWRCAFILMEVTGLRVDQLHRMISYNVPPLPRSGPLHLTLWAVLALTLPVYLVAPVLTGSITWAPSFNVITTPTGSVINVPNISDGIMWSEWRHSNAREREQTARQAVGLANIAWGRDAPGGSSKRVLSSSINLRVDSTINNVTLPYFHISSREWLSHPESVRSPHRLDLGSMCANITLSQNGFCPLVFGHGALGLIEHAAYVHNSELPASTSVITGTQMLALFGALRGGWSAPCTPEYFRMSVSDTFPANIRFYPDQSGRCWLFARVNYTSGVGTCIDCRVSSYKTVQADDTNPLRDLRGDNMAGPALSIMPTVIGTLVSMNLSIPSARGDIDEYVAEFLRRSYAVSWTSITNYVGEFDPQLNTTYRVALSASRALVNEERVYAWLGVQALVTVSGLLFLLVQANLETPMIRDTTLAAFYVDSSEVYEPGRHQSLQNGALIRIQYADGHMEAKVE